MSTINPPPFFLLLRLCPPPGVSGASGCVLPAPPRRRGDDRNRPAGPGAAPRRHSCAAQRTALEPPFPTELPPYQHPQKPSTPFFSHRDIRSLFLSSCFLFCSRLSPRSGSREERRRVHSATRRATRFFKHLRLRTGWFVVSSNTALLGPPPFLFSPPLLCLVDQKADSTGRHCPRCSPSRGPWWLRPSS
jgi:hypothetical protein